jgi:UDP-glucose 4-epimerase
LLKTVGINVMSSLSGKFKKALVTGGAGFIGSHIVESLLQDGLKVISIDDFSAGKKINYSSFIDNPNFSFVECDITDFNKLLPCFEGVDIVFHEAVSKNTVCMQNPGRDLAINAQGTLNILEASRKHNIKKFIHASTGSVYGDAKYYPTNEDHPVNPNSYYGVSKLAGEKYVRLFNHLYGMDVTILRYFHVYGPRQDYSDVGGVVSIFGRRAFNNKPLVIYGDGTQLRSFTSVYDVVNINKLVAQTKGTTAEAYNCASGVKITIQELAEKVLKHFAKPLKIEYQNWKPGDVKIFDVNNEKIKRLGFEFQVDFDVGLSKTLEWVEQHLKSKL